MINSTDPIEKAMARLPEISQAINMVSNVPNARHDNALIKLRKGFSEGWTLSFDIDLEKMCSIHMEFYLPTKLVGIAKIRVLMN